MGKESGIQWRHLTCWTVPAKVIDTSGRFNHSFQSVEYFSFDFCHLFSMVGVEGLDSLNASDREAVEDHIKSRAKAGLISTPFYENHFAF
jgi:hypothetical protein